MRLLPISVGLSLLMSAAAFAQTTTSPSTTSPASPSASTPVERTPPAPSTSTTAADDKAWMSKSLDSSDDKNLGSIVAVNRDSSGKVAGIEADIGGFLGIGSSRVMLTPSQYHVNGDRVILNMTSTQAKTLPQVKK